MGKFPVVLYFLCTYLLAKYKCQNVKYQKICSAPVLHDIFMKIFSHNEQSDMKSRNYNRLCHADE